jgi:hypothetical protein
MNAALSFNRTSAQPEGLGRSPDRSISGTVQAVEAGGKIRFRDDRNGDQVVVLTAKTELRKDGRPVAPNVMTRGTRFHGYAAFRGGTYFGKTLTIDQ